MGTIWTLHHLLATKYRIWSAAQLQAFIAERTGTTIHLNTLEALLAGPPRLKILDFTALEILCTALDCDLTDFCAMHPDK